MALDNQSFPYRRLSTLSTLAMRLRVCVFSAIVPMVLNVLVRIESSYVFRSVISGVDDGIDYTLYSTMATLYVYLTFSAKVHGRNVELRMHFAFECPNIHTSLWSTILRPCLACMNREGMTDGLQSSVLELCISFVRAVINHRIW